jgi:hypothetical protein
MAMCFLNLCMSACTSVYLRLPGDGILAQHIAVFKSYAQFAILLCAFVCDVIILPEFHTKHINKYQISVSK